MKDNQDKDKYKINYKPVYWILGLSPFVLTGWVLLLAKIPGIDLTNTGPIGDTIGGLTAPVIGLAGGILVYISFQAQLKANQMQFDALMDEKIRARADRFFDIRFDRIKQIKQDFRDIILKYPKNDNLDQNYVRQSDSKEDIIKDIEHDFEQNKEFTIFRGRDAFDVANIKLMTFDKVSKYAGFEIFTFLTRVVNILIDVNNEITRINNNTEYKGEQAFLIECYEDFVKSDLLPIMNMFLNNQHLFNKDNKNILERLNRIIDNHNEIKEYFK